MSGRFWEHSLNISFWFDVWLLSCPLFRSWDITGPPDRLVDYFLTQEEWNWDHQTNWELQHILTSIQRVRGDHPIHFKHIHREGNAAADALANMGMQERSYCTLHSEHLPHKLQWIYKLDRLGCPQVRMHGSDFSRVLAWMFDSRRFWRSLPCDL
ncbi:hypothetical protein F511_34470 [Dorcoceras hygrometricum]|uniref:RNase H type-1 domain-containing protein n=1 Tax=Dorcoceras hygrometricum TaxID=472368 RepID=A0A2Z7CQN0_9LAMI|nr:hypothetical protein F511_34470 [Dorcoceras hygrometricum]